MINLDSPQGKFGKFGANNINKDDLKKIVESGEFPSKSNDDIALEAIQIALEIGGEKSKQWFTNNANEIAPYVKTYVDELILRSVKYSNTTLLTQCLQQHSANIIVLNDAFKKSIESGNIEFVELLCQHGFDCTTQIDGKSPLVVAVELGNLPLLNTLLLARRNLQKVMDSKEDPLIAAVRSSNEEIYNYLLKNGFDNYSSLMRAVNGGDVKAVEDLVKVGADPFYFNLRSQQEQCSAFDTALKNNQPSIVAAFLGMKNPSIGCNEIKGLLKQFWVAFDKALKNSGDLTMLKQWLQKCPALVNLRLVDLRNQQVYTLLQLAVRSGNNLLANLLIERGANIDAQIEGGATLLHFAASFGKNEILKQLIDLKANVKATDNKGNTALHFAVKGDPETITLLINAGADIHAKNTEGATPLCFATANGHHETLRRLIELKANVNITDKYGNTPLHIALKKKHLKVALVLINAGLRIDTMNNMGFTPLHHAMKENGKDGVIYLLKNMSPKQRAEISLAPFSTGHFKQIDKDILDLLQKM
jgi:ankyrin repeat protein